MLALTTDDVRRALEEASGDELAPILQGLGVQARAAGRKAPNLIRARLRTLGHDALHDVAAFLTQPLTREFQALLPDDDGELAAELADGPLAAVRARWPVGMVHLALDVYWHVGELTLDERDRLMALAATPGATPASGAASSRAAANTGAAATPRAAANARDAANTGTAAATPGAATPTTPPPASVPPAGAPVAASATTVEQDGASRPSAAEASDSPPDVPATALDILVAEAVSRARPHDDAVRAAVEELLALDPERTHLWFQYGRVLGGDVAPDVPRPWGAAARRAVTLGRLRALVERGDPEPLRRYLEAERAAVDEVLAGGAGELVAAAVVAARLDDPRGAARLLDLVPRRCEGWERLTDAVDDRVEKLTASGRGIDAEILLRALEEALWRWASVVRGGDARLGATATAVALQRVACRRQRSDFVGAARLLAAVDERMLDRTAAAAMACEKALVAAEVPRADALRFPRTEAERTRLRERLQPAREHLREAADLDPGAFLPNLLLGMLLWCEGDPAAAGCLTAAQAQAAELPELGDCAVAVRFHAALARLRLLEPGTDEAAYHDMAAALDAGYRPGADDLLSAAVALEAHGSPCVGMFLASAMHVAPGDPGLTRLLVERARTGDDGARATVELFGLDTQLPLVTRFELLDAALAGAGVRRSSEDAERLAGAIDEVLVRANNADLDARFAEALAANETLRLALEPAHAEALRLEVLRRIGRVDEARAIAQALFYRAAGGGLRAFDPADLFDVLVELGLAPAELGELARLLPSPPDGEEPSPPALPLPVRVLFVGGNETQERYRPAVDAWLAERYDGKASVTWVLPGWRSNWNTDVARIEAAYPEVDVVVLMTFVRTHLGQRVRRSAGEHGLPWVACTGHGRVAIERAIDRAVAIVSEQVAVRR